ncbi:hypothetical protein EV363DRAFT_1301891 [Boletus edulis]|nr:hypothetical protein EV363DRAFT_1301891 [Boletus edulis]
MGPESAAPPHRDENGDADGVGDKVRMWVVGTMFHRCKRYIPLTTCNFATKFQQSSVIWFAEWHLKSFTMVTSNRARLLKYRKPSLRLVYKKGVKLAYLRRGTLNEACDPSRGLFTYISNSFKAYFYSGNVNNGATAATYNDSISLLVHYSGETNYSSFHKMVMEGRGQGRGIVAAVVVAGEDEGDGDGSDGDGDSDGESERVMARRVGDSESDEGDDDSDGESKRVMARVSGRRQERAGDGNGATFVLVLMVMACRAHKHAHAAVVLQTGMACDLIDMMSQRPTVFEFPAQQVTTNSDFGRESQHTYSIHPDDATDMRSQSDSTQILSYLIFVSFGLVIRMFRVTLTQARLGIHRHHHHCIVDNKEAVASPPPDDLDDRQRRRRCRTQKVADNLPGLSQVGQKLKGKKKGTIYSSLKGFKHESKNRKTRNRKSEAPRRSPRIRTDGKQGWKDTRETPERRIAKEKA